jgi:hypothetical protein
MLKVCLTHASLTKQVILFSSVRVSNVGEPVSKTGTRDPSV